jgi:hypothetical protein
MFIIWILVGIVLSSIFGLEISFSEGLTFSYGRGTSKKTVKIF